MNELDVLRAARKRITDPEKWCQGSYGTELFGTAGRSCLIAAVVREHHGEADTRGLISAYAEQSPAIRLLEKEVGTYVQTFNDTHTHAEVLALLDTVIAKLEEQTYGDELPPLVVELEQQVA